MQVTPSDGTDSGSTFVLTAGVTVQNTPPEAPTVSLSHSHMAQ